MSRLGIHTNNTKIAETAAIRGHTYSELVERHHVYGTNMLGDISPVISGVFVKDIVRKLFRTELV